MSKAAQIRSLCRDIQRQERSRAARIFDFIGLRVLSLLVMYLVFRMLLPQLWGAVVLALIGTAMVSIAAYMIQNTRLDRYTEKTSREFTDNLLLQKLIVMPREELYAWCSQLAWRTGGYRTVKEVAQGLIVERFGEHILFGICRRHPKSQLTPQDALEFYHTLGDTGTASGVLLSTAPLSDDCKAFLSRLDRDIALCGPERLLSLARRYGLLPADDTLEDELISELRAHYEARRANFSRFKKELLLPAKAKRYALCGLIILLGGLLIGQLLYYAVFASACFGLALLSLFRGGRQKRA